MRRAALTGSGIVVNPNKRGKARDGEAPPEPAGARLRNDQSNLINQGYSRESSPTSDDRKGAGSRAVNRLNAHSLTVVARS
jgi:hypothetical protein